jgi:hypothetical protein
MRVCFEEMRPAQLLTWPMVRTTFILHREARCKPQHIPRSSRLCRSLSFIRASEAELQPLSNQLKELSLLVADNFATRGRIPHPRTIGNIKPLGACHKSTVCARLETLETNGLAQ